jgi:hypothetical protein
MSAAWVTITSRNLTNARMIWMLAWTARGLFNTLDSIATPCSVNT